MIKRIASLTAASAALVFTASLAIAQTPPGLSALDRSDPNASKQDVNLRPHAAPPLGTPADKLPLDKIKLPPGFKAEIWSSGHPGGRTMVQGDKGTIFMGTRVIGRVS